MQTPPDKPAPVPPSSPPPGAVPAPSPFVNEITRLFGVAYPIVQAGMVWNSGWELAAAVSNAGALGLIGSGSMYPDVLETQIRKCRAATNKPFGVNIPLIYPDLERHIETVIREKVPIVFTSAGNPAAYTGRLRDQGIVVVHVVSSSRFARKAEDAGCNAVVAEGVEAGGHNGREETSTLVLVPAVTGVVKIPVIAAGGIGTGRQMFAVMALGAQGAQLGTRFVLSKEASSHLHFKNRVVSATEGDTRLSLKQVMPVRLLKNRFSDQVLAAETSGASAEELRLLLGRGRAKKGMFEGDLDDGELEIGQVSALLNDILPAAAIVENIWADFRKTAANPLSFNP